MAAHAAAAVFQERGLQFYSKLQITLHNDPELCELRQV
jgi:hypothetical protein